MRAYRGVLLFLAVAACDSHAPARIAVASDTLIINTRLWNSLGARVVDRSGRVVSKYSMRVSALPDSVLDFNAPDGVSCHGNGDALVTLTSGALRATRVVHCDLIKQLAPMAVGRLVIGEAPTPVAIRAYDKSGRLMSRLRVPVSVDDSNIVQLRNGMLTGLREGGSFLSVAGGNVYASSYITVYTRMNASSVVTLAAGETLEWPLTTGTHQFDIRFLAGGRSALITWPGTHCPDTQPEAEHHLTCLVRPDARGARLVFRNTGSTSEEIALSLLRTTAKPRSFARL